MNKEKKSISELEGWTWSVEVPTKDNSSYEEYNFFVLHNKPLRDYSIEDLYFMIGQESGLRYFVPLAIEILSEDLFRKADDYPGDLLKRLLSIDKVFWKNYPSYYESLYKILEKGIKLPNPDLPNSANKAIEAGLAIFYSIQRVQDESRL